MNLAISSRLQALRDFVSKANRRDLEPETASYLVKLGAVLACGTVERCVEIIVLDRLAHRAHPRVLSFIRSYFQRGTNYDCEAIEQLLARFDPIWADEFKIFVRDNSAIKEAVSSCYSVRNSVAHGGTQSMGGATLKDYSEKIIALVEALEAITAVQ